MGTISELGKYICIIQPSTFVLLSCINCAEIVSPVCTRGEPCSCHYGVDYTSQASTYARRHHGRKCVVAVPSQFSDNFHQFVIPFSNHEYYYERMMRCR